MQMAIADALSSVPVTSSLTIDIPDVPFTINFDHLFQTTTGRLEISLAGTLLETIFAPVVLDLTELLPVSILVDDPSLLALSQGLLEFALYPGSPAQMVIGNIVVDVDICTQNGWEIPFTQLTLHTRPQAPA